MKQLQLIDIDKLEYSDNQGSPIIGADEVLIRVGAAGICGSDIPRAYRDGAHKMPLILGHEFAGTVEETGKSVDSKWTGRRVGVFPLIPCRKCPQCLSRKYEMCQNYDYLGSRRDGGFAEYAIVPQWNLIELPDEVSFEAAAILEPMAVAVHAMRRIDIKSTDTVVVSGAGSIGLMLTMFLLDKGIENIIVICNHDIQKKALREIGVKESRVCDIRCCNAGDFIRNMTDGVGADVYYECVGANDSISQALGVVAPEGRICYIGNPHSDILYDKKSYWKILRNQLYITGSWNSSFYSGGEDETADDWRYVIKRLSEGAIKVETLITHRFTLDNIISGFELMRDKSEEYIKIICVME